MQPGACPVDGVDAQTASGEEQGVAAGAGSEVECSSVQQRRMCDEEVRGGVAAGVTGRVPILPTLAILTYCPIVPAADG